MKQNNEKVIPMNPCSSHEQMVKSVEASIKEIGDIKTTVEKVHSLAQVINGRLEDRSKIWDKHVDESHAYREQTVKHEHSIGTLEKAVDELCKPKNFTGIVLTIITISVAVIVQLVTFSYLYGRLCEAQTLVTKTVDINSGRILHLEEKVNKYIQ